jgi:hypothetical protein
VDSLVLTDHGGNQEVSAIMAEFYLVYCVTVHLINSFDLMQVVSWCSTCSW